MCPLLAIDFVVRKGTKRQKKEEKGGKNKKKEIEAKVKWE